MKKTHKDIIDDINQDRLVLSHAIASIKMTDPKAIRPGRDSDISFPKAALAFYKRNVDVSADPEFSDKEFQMFFDLWPDMYTIDDGLREIVLHEIEDSNPLTHDKMAKILWAYDYLDAESLNLRLFVYDRYGLSKRELNVPLLHIMIGPTTAE